MRKAVIPTILFCLILATSCTKSAPTASTDYWSSEKAACKDKTKGTLAFRAGCTGNLSLGYRNQGDNFKKWCACVEEKLAFPYLLNDKCELSSNVIIVALSNQDAAKLACGTPKDPR
mgnify:CR=1 FL=1